MKKIFALLLASMLGMSALAGCGKTEKPVDKVETEQPATNEATPEEPATTDDPTQLEAEITWWNFPNFQAIDDTPGKYEEQVIEAFNKKYPNIKVNMEMIDFVCNDEAWGPKNVVATNTFPVRNSFGNLYKGDETMTFLSSLTMYYSPYYNTIDSFVKTANQSITN